MAARYVIRFSEVGLADVPRVGGKNASLGELITHLAPLGVRVPGGFALTADAFRLHLRAGQIEAEIYRKLSEIDPNDGSLPRIAREVRETITSVELPAEVAAEVVAAYQALSREFGEEATDVAVRSSATAEDLPNASFAGQQETYLGVHGDEAVLHAVRDCMASLFTERAIIYRNTMGYPHDQVALSVGVQKMVRSDLGAAGVIFTLDPESGCRDVVVITGSYGLGELVVQGRVDPDELWVHKPTLATGHRSIIRRERGEKAIELVYAEDGLIERPIAGERRARFSFSDEDAIELARWAISIEQHYSKRAGRSQGMDIEWAKDGRTGELFVVQARPETVQSRAQSMLEVFTLQAKGRLLTYGKSVGAKIGAGTARIVRDPSHLESFVDGDVLVAAMTDPDWLPILRRASAIVTDHGGRTCHAAIVSRELGIPCVVGTGNATTAIANGAPVTVSCAEGDEGRVYEGKLPFERTTLDPTHLPVPQVPVMVNVGDPETAFLTARLPAAGVGLARIEFIVSSWIGIHPMALIHPDRVQDRATREKIRARIDGVARPDFFVERLATGVAQIAAAFFPRPVIVRFSDFKSNEYANLLGGAPFEPAEENPMIGFRGASRYYHPRYREAFALECKAIRKVRSEIGLTNVIPMIPFCRTLDEARAVLAEMAKCGLSRGVDGLQVYVMCEIPNNVILAKEFSELFDGFSIGSNDLTQLTLGIDRDSELLAPLFDEEDPGVKSMIRTVIERAHTKGRKVGLCGQAPSDKPEFAAFLADAGIDSISVTPDAFARVLQHLRKANGAKVA